MKIYVATAGIIRCPSNDVDYVAAVYTAKAINLIYSLVKDTKNKLGKEITKKLYDYLESQKPLNYTELLKVERIFVSSLPGYIKPLLDISGTSVIIEGRVTEPFRDDTGNITYFTISIDIPKIPTLYKYYVDGRYTLKSEIRLTIDHEMSHCRQDVLEKFHISYPQDIPKNILEELSNPYKTLGIDPKTKKYSKKELRLIGAINHVRYLMGYLEFDPWILSELENFKNLLNNNNIIDKNAILKAKKQYLAINQPKLSLIDLVKDIASTTKNLTSFLDKSEFFSVLKTVKPDMYNYAVKKFEADYNKYKSDGIENMQDRILALKESKL